MAERVIPCHDATDSYERTGAQQKPHSTRRQQCCIAWSLEAEAEGPQDDTVLCRYKSKTRLKSPFRRTTQDTQSMKNSSTLKYFKMKFSKPANLSTLPSSSSESSIQTTLRPVQDTMAPICSHEALLTIAPFPTPAFSSRLCVALRLTATQAILQNKPTKHRSRRFRWRLGQHPV